MLFFVCGEVPARQSSALRGNLRRLFFGRPSAWSCSWIGDRLARWWGDLYERRRDDLLGSLVPRLLAQDFEAVLETMAAAEVARDWTLEQWASVRPRAIGIRGFVELTRVLLGVDLPTRWTLARWERLLDLSALCARLLNDAGSLHRDVATMQARAEVADPNWILIRAGVRRDSHARHFDGLRPELDDCRVLHNATLAHVRSELEQLGAGPLRSLLHQVISGHDLATRAVPSRYADARRNLEGFERLGHDVTEEALCA